ncbi:hypothetical protein L3Y34_004090 [Caenorhabditis briggsae]|uniref:Uncharacterized protein n=1 Tax=Caenorhabditis briggsae TaxID=6238 RepID=A0AAE9AAU0_CAEBR|nr:hypothetical protein L3Y34_004090 [Caenorhabditis briggsae]
MRKLSTNVDLPDRHNLRSSVIIHHPVGNNSTPVFGSTFEFKHSCNLSRIKNRSFFAKFYLLSIQVRRTV